jgi:hypothetical protein
MPSIAKEYSGSAYEALIAAMAVATSRDSGIFSGVTGNPRDFHNDIPRGSDSHQVILKWKRTGLPLTAENEQLA